MDTLNRYLSIVFFRYLPADRKTKAGAAPLRSKKWLKEVYLIFLPHPGACIHYLDDKSVPMDNLFIFENIYCNLSTMRHGLHAVYKQIQEHLFQLKVVSTDQREAFCKSLFNNNPLWGQLGKEHQESIPYDTSHIKGLDLRLRGLCKVKEIRDDAPDPIDLVYGEGCKMVPEL